MTDRNSDRAAQAGRDLRADSMAEYLEASAREPRATGAVGSPAQMAAMAWAYKAGLGALLAQNGWL